MMYVHRTMLALTLVSAALVTSCSSVTPSSAVPDVLGGPTPLAAEDVNPDPKTVEVHLTARTAEKSYGGGSRTDVWTYNGTVPGPLVEANQGDRVIVHLKNELPEPTTIHWHGLRVPAAMDGTLVMQSPIEPGGTFTYDFMAKDAGLFWFHPHIRSDVQVQRGLYGVIRVRGPNEPVVDQEILAVLDDIRLNANGSIDESTDAMGVMMGREGNTILVNGEASPRFGIARGGTVRFRFVNVANGRFFNLSVPGHTWTVLGSDGGTYSEPFETTRLLITPGERYDVLLRVSGAPGEELLLQNEPYSRSSESGMGMPGMDTDMDMPGMDMGVATQVATLRLSSRAVEGAASAPTKGEGPRSSGLASEGTDLLVLNEREGKAGTEFTINDRVFPDVPLLRHRLGATRTMEVRNDSRMDHPFHLHGFFFYVVEEGGVATPLARLVEKDTVNIPQKSSVKLLVRFDEPGRWMYHCHILEHAEYGMMGQVDVVP